MALPWLVQKYLDDREFNCIQADDTQDFGAMRLCVLYLEDSLGPLQYVLPRSHMLRMHAMAETLGRNFTSMSPDNLHTVLDRLGLDEATGILPVPDFHTLVDQSVFGHSHYLLPSGRAHSLLMLDAEQIEQIIHDCDAEIVDFASDSRQPWPDDDDEGQILASVQNLTSLRIRQRLIETLEIPPLPDTARQILKLRLDPEASVEELAHIVDRDPSLNAQVICWASSPYYASAVPVHTTEEAITRVLGFDTVLNMTLGLSLGRTLSLPKDGPGGLMPYWQQAALTAYGMQKLVQAMPRPYSRQANTAYLCGLLHNFGFLILGHLFPLHFSIVCRHIEANPHLPVPNIEYLLLGVTRNQLSSWLLQTWGMPEEVVTALRYQDMPGMASEPAFLTRSLHITRQLLSGQPADLNDLAHLPLHADDANFIIQRLLEEQSDNIRALAAQMVT